MLPKDAYEKRASVRFLDVREQFEFDAGHVPESEHVPLMTLPERFAALDTEVTWIVTCQIGQRSDMAARFLRGHGFDAHNMDGGLEAWKFAGLPIATGKDDQGRIVNGHSRILDWL